MAANVSAEQRQKHAVLSDNRFPIFNSSTARSALKLRGHTKNKVERRKVIRAAAKFMPEMARRAWEKDKRAELI